MPKGVAWLTTLELESFVNNFADKETRAAFLGVFPIDKLPKSIPHLPLMFIINTNASNLPGQHWKAIYVSKNRNGEIFDSLATFVNLKLEQWMNTFTKRWTVSTLILQNPLSPSCGGYVLFYIMNRLKHNSLSSCISPFTSNVFLNEQIVERFFQNVQK